MSDKTSNHAGLLIPLDMFRISQFAALLAEQLVSKARNILDAQLVLTRHPEAPILLARIEGHVIGDDPAGFWRDNADLAALASRMFPRQVILYYAEAGLERREGFVVTQQGQAVAADDATPERMPPGATDADWPVARLCQQLQVSMEELADGFPTGPRVSVKLVEPNVDDQALLLKLLGRDQEAPEEVPGAARAPAAQQKTPPGATGAPKGKAAPPRTSVEDDAKRRAKQQAAQEAEQARRAAEVRADMPYTMDEYGLVVAPKADDLSEPDLLRPYIRAKLEGDLPTGLPRDLEGELQGRRIDIVVRVEFLSEVFVENNPLNRTDFQERAQRRTMEGREVLVLEVLGPRLGYGTLVSTGKTHVFVSRKLDLPLPVSLILPLL